MGQVAAIQKNHRAQLKRISKRVHKARLMTRSLSDELSRAVRAAHDDEIPVLEIERITGISRPTLTAWLKLEAK